MIHRFAILLGLFVVIATSRVGAQALNRTCGQSYLKLLRNSRVVHFDCEGDFRDASGHTLDGSAARVGFAADTHGGQSWDFSQPESQVRV